MKSLLFFLSTRKFNSYHRREEILEYCRQASSKGVRALVLLQPQVFFLSSKRVNQVNLSDIEVRTLWCLLPLAIAEKSTFLMWLFVYLPIKWQLREFISDSTFCWFYRPEQLGYILKKTKRIFLQYDYYAADVKPELRNKVEASVERCMSSSDLNLVCSKKLLEKYSGTYDCVYYPNAISKTLIEGAREHIVLTEHLIHRHTDIVRSLDDQVFNSPSSLKIGFVGSLDQSFDVELVEHCIKLNPSHQFVFVGPRTAFEVNRLNEYKNVVMTGRVDYSQLSSYIVSFDVCICPYKQDIFSSYRNPLKVFEYLAHNKPVLTTQCDLPDDVYKKVQIALTVNEFSSVLSANSAPLLPFTPSELESYHASNSWNARVELVLNIIFSGGNWGDKIKK